MFRVELSLRIEIVYGQLIFGLVFGGLGVTANLISIFGRRTPLAFRIISLHPVLITLIKFKLSNYNSGLPHLTDFSHFILSLKSG